MINPFENNIQQTRDIIFAIDRCKILDPACGSGAFPMGVLQKMVHILQKLDPENVVWKEIQLQKVQDETNEIFKTIDDKAEREEKLKEINNAFDQKLNDPDYARKLYLIENCIYGIDIQPIATQISKLRFFISLVVDQKSNDKKIENFGIRPLPNLETKFVAANTLIGIEKEANLFTTDKVKNLELQLKHIRHKLFSARTKDTKIKYRQKDEELRSAIAEELKIQGLPVDSAEKLAKWDPYDQNASSGFFDSEWMFDVSEGFSIIIGNPPYVNIANITDEKFRNFLKDTYCVAKNKSDLYSFFVEKGNRLLIENGILYFIISNSWMGTDSFSEFRNFLLKQTRVLELVQCHNNVFEASVTPVILGFKKSKVNNTNIKVRKLINENFIDENFILNYDIINQYDSKPFSFIKLLEFPIKSEKLGSFCHFTLGIKTSDDNKFLGDEPFLDNSFKMLRGKDIERFKIKFNEKYLWYRPDLMKLKKGAGSRNLKHFLVEKKILVKDVANKIEATLDIDQYLTNDTLNILYKTDKYSLEFLIGLLNSTLLNYWYKSIYSTGLHVKLNELREIPIALTSKKFFYFISFLTRLLLFHNKQEIFENVLNALVFELYFPNHLIEREINVLQFVEHDIEKVMQNRDFDRLNDVEKEQVLEQLYQIWTHPDNEVRNRMKLFAVRSPDILKPILES